MSSVSQKDARWMAWSRAPQPAAGMLQSKGLLLICGVAASWQGPAPAAVPALLELFPVPGRAGGMLNTKGSMQPGCWLHPPAAQACGDSRVTIPASGAPPQVPGPHFHQECHNQAFLLQPRLLLLPCPSRQHAPALGW